MSSSKLLLPSVLLAGLLVACEPPAVEPELLVTAVPRTIDGNQQKSVIKVTATDAKGKPGTGSVTLTSPSGSLKAGTSVALADGEGSVDFTCDRAVDATCSGTVRITGEWTTGGQTVTGFVNINVTPPVVVVPDAGLAITSSRTQIGIGLGNAADIVATYQVDGVPQAGTAVTLTTTTGTLGLPDGGTFTATQNTDSAGKVYAVLTENGTAGTATVTASAAGRTASVDVTIYTPDAGIAVTSDKSILTIGFNERALITVAHTLESRAVPGRPITLETTAGRFLSTDGGTFTSPALTDTNGQVQALLTDLGSPGMATITARDTSANVSATTSVTFAPPDAGVVVSVSKPNLYLGINDSVGVTASLYANGNPTPGATLNVSTSQGTLSLPDGGTFNGMGTTDAMGKVALVFRDTSAPGTATITATDPNSGRQGTAQVSVRSLNTITFDQMTCNAQPCTVLGINSSNFRTTGKLRFTVRDNQTQPVAGVNVTFSLTLSGAAGTSVSPASAVTDANGVVEATVDTGNQVGTFALTATVIQGVAATSPTFGVRGAKATSRGFTIQCNRTTMSAYTAPQPPLALTTDCTVTLVDRNNNPVGLATNVSLRSEAGAIPASVSTPDFTTGNVAGEGKAVATFSTVGDWPGEDVDPLPAVAGQYPFARVAEPQRAVGPLTRNPRDGLIVIIAWTRGEEWFNDLDGNGVQNGNEPFIDQGEPFVDVNDNDVFDGNDRYFNVDNDGVYTPGNGRWDGDAWVWTKTYVLYTDRSAVSRFSPGSGFSIAKGAQQVFNVWMGDLNLNRIEAGSSISFTRTATKGTVVPTFANYGLDDYGFDLEPRYLTNQAGTAACPTATDRICEFKTRFGAWSEGYVGYLTITGAPVDDMTPSQAESITVTTTTRGGSIPSNPHTGTIQ